MLDGDIKPGGLLDHLPGEGTLQDINPNTLSTYPGWSILICTILRLLRET